jgi:SAM-dependent methyltransferase
MHNTFSPSLVFFSRPLAAMMTDVASAYDASTERMRATETQAVREGSDASRTWMKQHYRRLVQEACDHVRKTRAGTPAAQLPLLLLDNGIGAGGLLRYAEQAGVAHVDANELSEARVDECRKHWQQQHQQQRHGNKRGSGGRGNAMTSDILQADAFSIKTRAHYQQLVRQRRQPYDVIVYHNTLHYGITSADVLAELMVFWRTILAPDGVVLIVTVDSDNLAYRVRAKACSRESDAPLVLDDNSLFQIRWPHAAPALLETLASGTPYVFSFHGSFHDAPEHVVNKQQLLALAEQHGFTSRTCYNLGFCCETTPSPAPMPAEQLDQLFLYTALVLRLV